jgi:transposase
MCLDKAYDSEVIRELLEDFGFTAHIRSRGEEAKSLKGHARKKARRWVVERSHSWINRFRAVLIRWAKRPDTYAAQLHLVFAIITWRATGLLG